MSQFPNVQVASLSQPALKKLEAVEQALGDVMVVAYESPVVPAKLSAEQVKMLQDAERELGVCLVAYEAK